MNVTTLRTRPITAQDHDLPALLDLYLPALAEASVLAVTSKIVSVTQGRLVKIDEAGKHALV